MLILEQTATAIAVKNGSLERLIEAKGIQQTLMTLNLCAIFFLALNFYFLSMSICIC
jgi:hypothetical protein